MTEFQISPLKEELADLIVRWRYLPPYQVYDLSPADKEPLLDPAYRYHQVLDGSGNLIGYCCFGEDARVPGGVYPGEESEYLDVGVGMHPSLVGRGKGAAFVGEILEYARDRYQPAVFRVTIADFNQRSLKTFRKLGFKDSHHFKRKPDGMPFTQLERSGYEGSGKTAD
jgi:RimJ/RimL family protein N-acetyltransferase